MAVKIQPDTRWCCTSPDLPNVQMAQCVKVTNVTKAQVTFHTANFDDQTMSVDEFLQSFRLTDCYGCKSLP